MTSLLAIVLVISSSRGHHFVFNYPTNPKRRARTQQVNNSEGTERAEARGASPSATTAGSSPTSGKEELSGTAPPSAFAADPSITSSSNGNSVGRLHSQQLASRHPRAKALPKVQRRWSGSEGDNTKQQQVPRSNDVATVSENQTVLGFNTQFLANVLTPKKSLCDRRFQMTVDDLTFLGHPVYIGSEREQSSRRTRKSSGPPNSAPVAAVGDVQSLAPRSSLDPTHRRAPSLSAIPTAGLGIETPLSWKSGHAVLATPSLGVGSNGTGGMPMSAASSPEVNFLHPKTDDSPAARSCASSPVPPLTPLSPDVTGGTHSLATPVHGPSALLRTSVFNQRSNQQIDPQVWGVSPTRPGGAPLRHNSVPMVLSKRATTCGLSAAPAHHSHSAVSPFAATHGIISNAPCTPTPTPSLQSALISPVTGDAPYAPGEPPTSSTLSVSSTAVYPCPPINTTVAATANAGPTSATQMTSFHVAFILDPGPLERNRVAEEVYRQIVKKLSMALRHEQMRCRYVAIEAEKILKIKDGAVFEGFTQEETLFAVLNASSLARDLSEIYHAIVGNRIARIVVNGYIDLSLQVPKIWLPSVGRAGGSASEGEQVFVNSDVARSNILDSHHVADTMQLRADGATCLPQAGVPRFAPYLTLLLLEDKGDILRALPVDASGVLIKLLEVLTPTKCFAELHILCDTSLAQLYKVAAHLVYWRKARVVDVISSRNVYVVSPSAPLDTLAELVLEFKRRFADSTIDLLVLLADLSPPRPFSSLIPSRDQRSAYLDAAAFLLARGIVIQLHTYIYLLIPPHVKLGLPLDEYERLGYGSALAAVAGDTTRIVSVPAQATEMERDWISKLTRSQAGPVAEHFRRLLQYFNGTHSAEEIMFRENITRRDLKTVIASFREELITVMRFDR